MKFGWKLVEGNLLVEIRVDVSGRKSAGCNTGGSKLKENMLDEIRVEVEGNLLVEIRVEVERNLLVEIRLH